MGMYVVERYLVGWTSSDVRGLLDRIAAAAGALATTGVRHVASVYIPGDETCLCMFEAGDAAALLDANERQELPVGRIVEGELLTAARSTPIGGEPLDH